MGKDTRKHILPLQQKILKEKLYSTVPLEEAYEVRSININAFLLLIQNEIKYIKRKNESKLTLSKEICSTLGNLLGGEYLSVGNMQTEKLKFCVYVLL